MSDLIDRQAAIDAMRKLHADDVDMYGAEIPECFDDKKAINALETLPTVYPEQPKRGKWVRYYIRPNVFKDLYWHCSECGHRETYSYANRYYKFCPCCGAYMGGENGND